MALLQMDNKDKQPSNPVLWMEDRFKLCTRAVFDRSLRAAFLSELQRESIRKHKTLDRTLQFWTRSAAIYSTYKACQLRVLFVRDEAEKVRIWEEQHERAADKVYALCYDLKGFFLKTAQLLAKPDLSPMAWVKRLVVLCDQAPQTPLPEVMQVLEEEFGRPFYDIFERFDDKPLGSASVAQVVSRPSDLDMDESFHFEKESPCNRNYHSNRNSRVQTYMASSKSAAEVVIIQILENVHRARVKGAKSDVAVKVQHPGAHELMMTDIRNQKIFAHFLQRFDLRFDLISIMDELEEQVEHEFDFRREADSMDRIGESLEATNRGNCPIIIPRSVTGMVTRRVLVMDFLEGTPIMQLQDEMEKRGINPNGRIAKAAKGNILKDLSSAYGQMILRDGFFQADPHPGNILINKKGKVALLDYGQTKELSEELRLGYAKIVVALANNSSEEIVSAFRSLGIKTSSHEDGGENSDRLSLLAKLLFDTKLPDGWAVANPFGDDSILKIVRVEKLPKELFFIVRVAQLLRGLSIGMGVPFSASEHWRPLAVEALKRTSSSPVYDAELERSCGKRELVWERRRRLRKNGRLQAEYQPHEFASSIALPPCHLKLPVTRTLFSFPYDLSNSLYNYNSKTNRMWLRMIGQLERRPRTSFDSLNLARVKTTTRLRNRRNRSAFKD